MAYAPRRYPTAGARWAGFGPYYAMFPVSFADWVIRRHSRPSDLVLDPFAGRGTAVFSAATQERVGLGIELNPVGWVYSRTKLAPAPREMVEKRIRKLASRGRHFQREAAALPEFFRLCFSPSVRRFLLAARGTLDWRHNRVDRTTMAFLLVHLHGKRTDSLSNQLRQTKAMSPQYAIRWWREREMKPPDLDPVAFLDKRLAWRYAKGVPEVTRSRVYMRDSVEYLPRLKRELEGAGQRRVSLLFTSPPYLRVTNYHYDQWLRLWMLGGKPTARRVGGRYRGKFESPAGYRTLLRSVFGHAAGMLRRDAHVYVRTDRRKVTCDTTCEVLRDVFPGKRMIRRLRNWSQPTQTRLFGDCPERGGEVDLVLVPR